MRGPSSFSSRFSYGEREGAGGWVRATMKSPQPDRGCAWHRNAPDVHYTHSPRPLPCPRRGESRGGGVAVRKPALSASISEVAPDWNREMNGWATRVMARRPA
jgi:hypothetical protein